jgi:hypothetical protein
MTTPSSTPGKPNTPSSSKPSAISDDAILAAIAGSKPEPQDGPKGEVDKELGVTWPDGDDSLHG